MDNLKEIIEAEVESKYRYDGPHVKFAFKEGCNFMAGYLEGLLEFTRAMSWMRTDTGETLYDLEDGKGYVVSPSQLIDKYFNELNSKG